MKILYYCVIYTYYIDKSLDFGLGILVADNFFVATCDLCNIWMVTLIWAVCRYSWKKELCSSRCVICVCLIGGSLILGAKYFSAGKIFRWAVIFHLEVKFSPWVCDLCVAHRWETRFRWNFFVDGNFCSGEIFSWRFGFVFVIYVVTPIWAAWN